MGPWLVSSSNIAGCRPGEELLGPKTYRTGKITCTFNNKKCCNPPADIPNVLVVSPESSDITPLKMDAEIVEPDWQESSTAIVAVEKQQEALEDWYGRLGDDGSFPHLEGNGPVDAPMAVLRMLARYFDLPFRKDVIQRIIEDQLRRKEDTSTDSQTIGLIQLAAVSDLIGLRATSINVVEKQIGRIQLPAIALIEDEPIIIWSADVASQALISNPTSGQKPFRLLK